MARPITFIKYFLVSEQILLDIRAFTGLSPADLNLLIASLFIGLDENKTIKTFDLVDLSMMHKKLTGNPIGRIYDRSRTLIKKGYFTFIKNEVRQNNQHAYYAINQEKIIYFISALDSFIEYRTKDYKSVPEFNNYAIKYRAYSDVLKHIREVKKIVKLK
jgi:hypothetical protein